MPRRPARPVSWVYSPGVSVSWRSPVNLVSFSITTRPGRHVDPDRERLGGEHDLDQPLDEARLDDLLERRHHPGVVGGDAGLELARTGRSRARPGRRRRGRPGARRRSRGSASRSSSVGEPQPGVDTGPRRLVALVAAEDEVDRRQQLSLGEHVDGLDPARGRQLPLAAPSRRVIVAAPRRKRTALGVEAAGVGVGMAVDERRQQLQAVVASGRRRGRGCRAAPGGAPRPRPSVAPRTVSIHSASSAGVADRRRQAHQPHVHREVDDHLLPHRPAVGVLQEVHLVEHDEPEVVERRGGRRSCCAAPRWSSPRPARRR